MKCKSWSNKINNFVVRRLKSIKVNGTQQQQQQQQSVQQQSSSSSSSPGSAAAAAVAAVVVVAASSSSNASSSNSNKIETTTTATMPAMPKEKAASVVSLSESNFSELNLKELAVVVGAMATTAAAAAATTRHMHHTSSNNSSSSSNSSSNNSVSTCGCGSISAPIMSTPTTTTTAAENNNNNSRRYSSHKCLKINGSVAGPVVVGGALEMVDACSSPSPHSLGHSSPLAAAVASNISPARYIDICCRQQYHNGLQQQQQQQHLQQQQEQPQQTLRLCQKLRQSMEIAAPETTTAIKSGGAATTGSTPTTTAATAATTTQQVVPRKSPKDYIFKYTLGEGSFSMVYLGVDIHTRREYAIKVCEKRLIWRERKQDYVKREKEVMHLLSNVPGFVNLSCTFQNERSLFFVMTHAKKGDLLPYINRVGSFDVSCTRHYAAELLLACEHMHRRNVVHRDLKPENILLDEDMHTLIADFGSSKMMTDQERTMAAAQLAAGVTSTGGSNSTRRRRSARSSDDDEDSEELFDDEADYDDDEEEEEDTEEADGDEVDSPSHNGGQQQQRPRPQQRRQQQQRWQRRRRGSFVGTAQYVSPEVLQNLPITPAADLWALGCIVYQMISGLPPFRGTNDYVIFQQILSCSVDFPQGFDKDAEDLVRRLLKVEPSERLGAQDEFGYYQSIRQHPFFEGIDWETLRQQTPPPIYPYLPGVGEGEETTEEEDEDFQRSSFCADLEPGLDERQMTRLLGMEFGVGTAAASAMTAKKKSKNSFILTDAEKLQRLEEQKTDKWHVFADGEVILRKGFINKRKGLFARKRMLLLTTGPRLIYIDPVQMIKKGEIPWSPELRVEAKNFRIFFVHTPNRTYYLDDPSHSGHTWRDDIENMYKLTYGQGEGGGSGSCISSTSSNLAVNSAAAATTTNSSASSNSSPTARRNSPTANRQQQFLGDSLLTSSSSSSSSAANKKTASN